MLLKESASMGDILLITSIKEGLSQSKWQQIVPDPAILWRAFGHCRPGCIICRRCLRLGIGMENYFFRQE